MTDLADTDPVAYHLQRTSILLELRKHQQAAREVRRALQHAPNHAEAHRLLAVALWGQGQLLQARSAAETALELAPDDADIHSTLALILHRLRKDDRARVHHESALSLLPQVSAFHVRYARFLLHQYATRPPLTKTLWVAWREAQTARQLDPRNADAHLACAWVLRAQRRLPQAEAATREALAIAPNDAHVHELLGDILVDRHQGAEAFASYREALRLNPGNSQVKRKVSLALQARLWRLGQESSALHRVLWVLFTAMTTFLCWQAGWRDTSLAIVYGTFYALILLWGLFLWVVDPVITYGVIKGWIKISEV